MRTASALFATAVAVAAPALAEARDELPAEQTVSAEVVEVAAWAIASGDTKGLPFAVVDKRAAQVLVFDAAGKLQGLAPALLGSAPGDESPAYVADVKALGEIAPEHRTTPAGRFLASYGPAKGGKRVLWVDYNTAVSLHPLAEVDASEHRQERLASPTAGDNRVTYGCINVSPVFYREVVRPTFKRSGVVYVLPETSPIEAALPGFGTTRTVAVADRSEKPRRRKR